MQAALSDAAAQTLDLLGQDALVSAAARLLLPEEGVTEAAVNPDALHFPASLVKLFHAASFLRAVASGAIVETAEDHRALEALLKLSSNDADQYLIRRLCPPPPEAIATPPPAHMAAREALSSAWHMLDPVAYRDLRVSNATYIDGPFGVEAETRRALGRNQMTARAVLAMLGAIAGGGDLLAADDAARMRGWLDRAWARPPSPAAGTAGQVAGFLAQAMPADAAVWSKGGWTEETRHDALRAVFPDGTRLTLVVLVSAGGLWGRDDILPSFAATFLAGIGLGERR
jgi:hypothetical protein